MIPESVRRLFQTHSRNFEENRYVYPVVSRRAGGVSIGVNLNLDRVCNFGCVYCQVNRTERVEKEFVDLARLEAEVDAMVEMVTSGKLFEHSRFLQTPPALQRLNDIAMSGDGEPTTYRNFDEVVRLLADVRRRRGLNDLKLVLITNASMLHREPVQRGLALLDGNNGEIWAKLDAGTDAYYQQVIRSKAPFQQILDNLLLVARQRPIVIQSLFMRLRGESPTEAEQEAYCDRLNEIISGGGAIRLVQIHTVARPPAETWVTALPDAEVDALVALVRRRTRLPVAGYYGCH